MTYAGWIPDVVPDAAIESQWGNTVRNRTLTPFANAAARDTAIPTPVAGMICYLTGSNVVQVYNGSKWVTISPQSATVAATQSTSSATYVDLTTVGPAVTLDTGTAVLISLAAM